MIRPLSTLKGRDLRALRGFRERLRSSLGKALVSVAFLARRAIEVAPGAVAPRARPGSPPQPLPEPPGELRVLVRVERRDMWVEERVDLCALEIALETGVLVAPYVFSPEELATPHARASRISAEIAHAQEVE